MLLKHRSLNLSLSENNCCHTFKQNVQNNYLNVYLFAFLICFLRRQLLVQNTKISHCEVRKNL